MKVHQRIKQHIEKQGLKMNFVADKAGINPKRFYRLVNGDSPLVVDEYEVICKGLEVDMGYFFGNQFLESKNLSGNKIA